MGLPAWAWFVLAILAGATGVALLGADRARITTRTRDRQRWATLKGWDFTDGDPMLLSRWRYGTVHQGGYGRARRLATGAVPGPDGRRLAHVFDLEQAGRITAVIAAVHIAIALPVALELRLPSAPLPEDAGLEHLGPVGSRYAFVTDTTAARPLVTPALAEAADAVGADVPLLWAEDSWVLATAPVGVSSERVQELLLALVDVAVVLERYGGGADVADPLPPSHGSA